jgi:hypothetical protein
MSSPATAKQAFSPPQFIRGLSNHHAAPPKSNNDDAPILVYPLERRRDKKGNSIVVYAGTPNEWDKLGLPFQVMWDDDKGYPVFIVPIDGNKQQVDEKKDFTSTGPFEIRRDQSGKPVIVFTGTISTHDSDIVGIYKPSQQQSVVDEEDVSEEVDGAKKNSSVSWSIIVAVLVVFALVVTVWGRRRSSSPAPTKSTTAENEAVHSLNKEDSSTENISWTTDENREVI